MSGPRIASLLASATEIVCALGFEEQLVARSHECDYPVRVTRLPSVTESKVRTETESRLIDTQVKEIVEQGLSVYKVDAGRLRALDPGVIVTQTQCEVCAVSYWDLEAALRDWTGGSPRVVSLEPNALGDVWRDIARVAAALDAPERGTTVIARLRARMDSLAAAVPAASPRPRVACIEWIDPLMAAGNWMPELVAMAGGTDLFGTPGAHAPWMRWDALVEAGPDIILIMPCGFDIARAREDMGILLWARRAGVSWQRCRAGAVYLTDGNQYFNRPGPRIVESLEILAEIFHPSSLPLRARGNRLGPLRPRVGVLRLARRKRTHLTGCRAPAAADGPARLCRSQARSAARSGSGSRSWQRSGGHWSSVPSARLLSL